MNHPMRFFGGLGFVAFLIGLVAGFIAVALKLLDIRAFVDTPLPVFSAMFLIVGIQMIVMGILAEMLMRTYYESQGKRTYMVADKINMDLVAVHK